ncbi:MAG: hypothetical protein V9E81_01765 [Marmoricola sp.]
MDAGLHDLDLDHGPRERVGPFEVPSPDRADNFDDLALLESTHSTAGFGTPG